MKLVHYIRIELNHLFLRKEFYISFIFSLFYAVVHFLTTCIILYGSNSFESLSPAYQYTLNFGNYYRILSVLPQIYIYFILLIISPIAFGDTYTLDRINGVQKFIFTRCSKIKYIISKAIVITLSVIIVVTIPLLINQLLILLIAPLDSSNNAAMAIYSSYQKTISSQYDSFLFENFPYIFNVIMALVMGLYAAIISLVSYAISLLIKVNRITVLILPWIIGVILNLLFSFFHRPLKDPTTLLGVNFLIRTDKGAVTIITTIIISIILVYVGITTKIRYVKDEL